MNLIDLHVHTTASDGILSPAGIIEKAEKEGLIAIAIADHDTIEGVNEAVEAAQSITVLPSIEFSVAFKGGTFHLLGMNLNHYYEPLINKSKELKEMRDSRTERILSDLAAHAIYIDLDEVLEESQGGTVGRPHIARCLVKHGYGESITEIFQKYLVKGKPGFAPKEKISLEEAMDLILKANGIPVIAHPVSLNCNKEDFVSLVKIFKDMGGLGIEAYASMHSEEDISFYIDVAKKHSLLISGGSDYHGDKDEALGYYHYGKAIPGDLYKRFL